MATRNFLFLLLLALILQGCSSVQRRQTRPTVVSGPAANQKTQSPSAPTDSSVAAPPEATITAGAALPVGLYLGPGLMRSFVEVGILKAFAQAQIPIVSIGGEEWGAIVAGLYAFSKSGNDVEWQMLKLHKDQVPSSGFLRPEVEPKDSASLSQFLRFIFGDKNLSSTKIPFSCTAAIGLQTQVIRSGRASEEIAKCASLPPFYKPAPGGWISGAVSANSDWLDMMLKDGAKFIIYVDVLGDSPVLTRNRMAHGDDTLAILTAVRSASQWRFFRANMVLKVPVQEDILSFDGRRELIKQGEKFAAGILPEIMKQIGMNQ